jgi:ABC-2 type transport system permease protein
VRQACSFFLRVMLARAYPRVIALKRHPGWLVMETVLPVLSVSAFALVYRAMQAPQEYLGFAILGGAVTAFWLNVIWSMGAQFYWDREAGNLELFLAAPASLMAILAGMALGGMVITLVRASAIVLVGALVFGVPFVPSSWFALLLTTLLLMLALYGLGMVFASVFLRWGRQALHVVSLLQEPVYVFSGLHFPIRVLGTMASSTTAILPLTIGVDALRQILFPRFAGQGLLPVWVEVILLAAQAVLFIALARYLLNRLERQAREQGRLTVRWL